MSSDNITLLVIDDYADNIEMVRRAVAGDHPDWVVIGAGSGMRGLQLAQARAEEIDLIMLDLHLPDLDGSSVCVLLREIRWDFSIVLFSAYRQKAIGLDILCPAPLLRKPASTRDILQAIEEALALPPPSRQDRALALYPILLKQAKELVLHLPAPDREPPSFDVASPEERMQAILALIAHQGPMKIQQIAALLQPAGVTRRTFQRDLLQLVAQGLLYRGARQYYHLVQELHNTKG